MKNINMYNQNSKKEILSRVRNLRRNQTPQEIILWSRLRNRKVKDLKFRRQHLIGKYIVDFVCLERKLIVELDGWQHKIETHKEYDKERTEFLIEEGFEVLRFWNNEINNNLDGVILRIEELL